MLVVLTSSTQASTASRDPGHTDSGPQQSPRVPALIVIGRMPHLQVLTNAGQGNAASNNSDSSTGASEALGSLSAKFTSAGSRAEWH